MITILVKSVEAEAIDEDGFRVLVDGNLPSSMTEEQAKLDLWQGSIAPSPRLYKWFGGNRDRWDDFLDGYFTELDANSFALTELFQKLTGERLTLLYASRDARYNTAVALKIYLEGND
jgi:uncharacterized protein YeaO (DUF488 family)